MLQPANENGLLLLNSHCVAEMFPSLVLDTEMYRDKLLCNVGVYGETLFSNVLIPTYIEETN